MGKSTASAPAPDKNIGTAALLQAKTGQEWLSFAKDAFEVSQTRQAELDDLTRQVTEQQLGVAGEQAGWARSDRDRYETTFKPIEDQFIEEAAAYGSEEKQAEAAATARADVLSAAERERDAGRRKSFAYGIRPDSGRYQGVERAADLETAVAAAGASNSARRMERDKGLGLKADVANLGRGLPAQSAQAASLGLGAGNSAVNNNLAANNQYLASTGIVGSGYGGAMAGYGGQASTLNNLYSNQLSGWNAQQQADATSSSGMFSGLGTLAGVGLSMWSDEKVKKNKKPVKSGDGLKAVKKMPVEEWSYKPGKGDGGRHVGTYAQDFQKATGRGDGKTIPVVDAIGITMKAVQDLDEKVEGIAQGIGEFKRAA